MQGSGRGKAAYRIRREGNVNSANNGAIRERMLEAKLSRMSFILKDLVTDAEMLTTNRSG